MKNSRKLIYYGANHVIFRFHPHINVSVISYRNKSAISIPFWYSFELIVGFLIIFLTPCYKGCLQYSNDHKEILLQMPHHFAFFLGFVDIFLALLVFRLFAVHSVKENCLQFRSSESKVSNPLINPVHLRTVVLH